MSDESDERALIAAATLTDEEREIAVTIACHAATHISKGCVDCACGWTHEPTPKPGEAILAIAHRNHVAQQVESIVKSRVSELLDENEMLRSEVAIHDDEANRLHDGIRELADEWESDLGPCVPIERDGTCDACSETKRLVASYPLPDSEPWLCAECDADTRKEINELRALLSPEPSPVGEPEGDDRG